MKTDMLQIRVQPDEKAAFQEVADLAGLPLSSWVRLRLRQSAIRELEEASRPIKFLKSQPEAGE